MPEASPEFITNVAKTKRQAVLHVVQGAPEVIQRPQGQGPEETLRNLDKTIKTTMRHARLPKARLLVVTDSPCFLAFYAECTVLSAPFAAA